MNENDNNQDMRMGEVIIKQVRELAMDKTNGIAAAIAIVSNKVDENSRQVGVSIVGQRAELINGMVQSMKQSDNLFAITMTALADVIAGKNGMDGVGALVAFLESVEELLNFRIKSGDAPESAVKFRNAIREGILKGSLPKN
jgi:hypothetical protein